MHTRRGFNARRDGRGGCVWASRAPRKPQRDRGPNGSFRAVLPLAPRPGDRSPAQERVFQIFSSRMTMAARWDRSPVSRKMFMAAAVGAAQRPRGSAATQDAATAPERGSGERWRERARRGQGRGRTAVARAGQPGRAGDRWGHAPATPLKGPAAVSNRTLHLSWAAN